MVPTTCCQFRCICRREVAKSLHAIWMPLQLVTEGSGWLGLRVVTIKSPLKGVQYEARTREQIVGATLQQADLQFWTLRLRSSQARTGLCHSGSGAIGK